jgi:hypothetical protein
MTDLEQKLKDSVAIVEARKNGGQVAIGENAFPGEDQKVTPMDLIQIAVNKDADIGKLEKLFELQLRWEANEAKKAFVAAMNAFKADAPDIIKNRNVSYQTKTGLNVAYSHATLDQVCDAVIEGLSKHDIHHSWKIEQKSRDEIKVTCVLTHKLGHSEETSMFAGPDDSGGKNAIQALASSTSYLERYTLLAATGLAAKGMDNDGQGAPKWEKLQEYLDSISTAPNLKVLTDTFNAGFKEATKVMNTQAMQLLVKAKDERKKLLAKEHEAQ